MSGAVQQLNSYDMLLTAQHDLVLSLRMCRDVNLEPPKNMQLTAELCLVLRLRMCGAVPILPAYNLQLTAQQ